MIFTGIAKLLTYLHRVFDKTPDSVLAFRINSDGTSLAWEVTETQFKTTVAGGTAQPLTIDLAGHTIASLGAYIAAQPGYTVLALNSEVTGRSAYTLVPGTGTAQASNGDHIYAFRSPLWSYLAATAAQLNEADTQIREMLDQLIVTESDGEWADLWGTYYKIARRSGETDSVFTRRIIYETLRPKSNALAMENAIKDDTGVLLTLREPWKERFIPSRSTLSGPHHLQNVHFYWYNVVEAAVADTEYDSVRTVVMATKPAGTAEKYLHTQTNAVLDASGGYDDDSYSYRQYNDFINMSSIGPRSYNNGGTVYDEWGNTYTGLYTYTPTHMYTVLAAGTPGADTIPLHAGANWYPSILHGLGYMAGDTVLAVEEQFFTPMDTVETDAQQTP